MTADNPLDIILIVAQLCERRLQALSFAAPVFLRTYVEIYVHNFFIFIMEENMDASSILTTLLGSSSVSNIGKACDTDSATVSAVLAQALPALLKGADKQASNTESAKGFASALAEHAGANTANLGTFMKNVDLDDGAKIVRHLLGSSEASTTKSIAKTAGINVGTVSAILAAAAPLLMSLLGKSAGNNTSGDALSSLIGGVMKNVNVGDMLGGLLGASGANEHGAAKKSAASGTAKLAGSLLKGLLK